jgi:hypothetical protein
VVVLICVLIIILLLLLRLLIILMLLLLLCLLIPLPPATISALVGGFALTTLVETDMRSSDVMVSVSAMCFYAAVHACTFSACAGAWIFQMLNTMDDKKAERWVAKRSYAVKSPWISFAMGAMCYIVGVVVFTAINVGPNPYKLTVVIGVAALCALSFMSLLLTSYFDD